MGVPCDEGSEAQWDRLVDRSIDRPHDSIKIEIGHPHVPRLDRMDVVECL